MNTSKKIIIGLLVGIVMGIIDVIPMIIQKLTWDANISAFTMWIVIGIIVSLIDIKLNSIIKGILFGFLIIAPIAILIGWKQPVMLIPIFSMTFILSGLTGFLTTMLNKKF